MSDKPAGSVRQVAALFLRLGIIAFGGPPAHIAMMRSEVVQRRQWLDDQEFLDLVGSTHLIPGPNSTELAIYLGFRRARWRGLLVAGVCFILPAAVIVTALAWAYVRYDDLLAIEGLLYGIVPVVIAIVIQALMGLTRTAVKTVWLAALAAAGIVAYFAGVNELLILAAGAIVAVAVHLARSDRRPPSGVSVMMPVFAFGRPYFDDPTGHQLAELFTTMLKIGAILYGSGYVLLAFLQSDFVDRLGWITQLQLVDAVSVGQVTPGPVFTTATFVGYLVAGLPGAFLATVAIFLPSFVLIGLLTRLTTWLRASDWTSALLDGVNVTSLALMAGVTVDLGRASVNDPTTIFIAVAALMLLILTKLNNGWLIVAGAAIGLAHVYA